MKHKKYWSTKLKLLVEEIGNDVFSNICLIVSCGSAVVPHLTTNPEIEGLNPAITGPQ